MSDFGGNNEADSKLRQHCIALEAEVSRLMAELAVARSVPLDVAFGWIEERDALAMRCRELEAACREQMIRLTDLFDRHERPTYAEGSNPDTDLDLILATGREALDAVLKGAKPACSHDRLNEDGVCRTCGQDARGIQ